VRRPHSIPSPRARRTGTVIGSEDKQQRQNRKPNAVCTRRQSVLELEREPLIWINKSRPFPDKFFIGREQATRAEMGLAWGNIMSSIDAVNRRWRNPADGQLSTHLDVFLSERDLAYSSIRDSEQLEPDADFFENVIDDLCGKFGRSEARLRKHT
jgi:hypothetical protein